MAQEKTSKFVKHLLTIKACFTDIHVSVDDDWNNIANILWKKL